MTEASLKPKPRPRPRPRVAASSNESVKPGSSSQSPRVDEDAMFIRNRNRSAMAWNKMNEAVEKREAARAQSADVESSDSDSPRAYKTKRPPFTAKPKQLPAWTKSNGLIQIEDSDSERESEKGSGTSIPQTQQERSSPQATPTSKRKRKPSHSSSESSSEPEILLAEQKGREIARQVLSGQTSKQESSPVYVWDDNEEEDVDGLPPELAAIKAEVKRNSARVTGTSNNPSSIPSVELKITLKPHPEDESGRSYIYSHTMKRNEKFEQLFEEIADAGGIPSERLVVFFNNNRVYPWSTPQTLLIWSEAELVAYEEHVYKYIKAHGHRISLVDDFSTAPPPTSTESTAAEFTTEPEPSQDRADAFKLQVRCGERTITVNVRPTTKCGAIVENVLTKIGRRPTKKARIEVDGDKLDPESEIGGADLEDGDLVDIVGA